MKHDNDNKPIRFLSVCSGIEAASVAFGPLGWKAVAFSEIEKFPSAVLAHHYPDVPNLGDMTKFKDWPDFEIDMLCGGTPCQSFSVAGLRQGLADPRGNLTLTFLAIADKYKPEWIVWENVPGILSDKTGALSTFMEGLNSLGYTIDADILDAQNFGLAQRRRRVVLVCHNVNLGRKKKNLPFAISTLSFLTQTLLTVLVEHAGVSALNASGSVLPEMYSARLLKKKMKFFGVQRLNTPESTITMTQSFLTLLGDLDETCRQYRSAQKRSEYSSARSKPAECIQAEKSPDGSVVKEEDDQFTNTPQSWSSILGALLETANASTTSIATKTTTTSEIFTCAQASLSIVKYTTNLMTLPQDCLDEVSSGLIALRGYMKYARWSNDDMVARLTSDNDWGRFADEADATIRQAERYLGDRAHSGTIFPLPASLQGNPPPRGETGKDVAPTISARTKGGGGLGTDFDLDGGLVQQKWPADIASTLDTTYGSKMGQDNQHVNGGCPLFVPSTYAIQGTMINRADKDGPQGSGVAEDVSFTLTKADRHAVCITGEITHSLKAEGADASEDGTGRGNPIVFSQLAPTIKRDYGKGYGDGEMDAGGLVAQSVSLRGREGGGTAELGDEIANALRASGGGGDKAHVMIVDDENGNANEADASSVRRLTPVECERLMGFPDNYTNIPYRGKPTSPDGPRYKALGNSWAVPKFTWIGERIARFMPIDSVPANDNKKAAA